jgi:hypothetical protein
MRDISYVAREGLAPGLDTYQNVDTVSTDDSNHYGSDGSENHSAVFEGHWHSQDTRP